MFKNEIEKNELHRTFSIKQRKKEYNINRSNRKRMFWALLRFMATSVSFKFHLIIINQKTMSNDAVDYPDFLRFRVRIFLCKRQATHLLLFEWAENTHTYATRTFDNVLFFKKRDFSLCFALCFLSPMISSFYFFWIWLCFQQNETLKSSQIQFRFHFFDAEKESCLWTWIALNVVAPNRDISKCNSSMRRMKR